MDHNTCTDPTCRSPRSCAGHPAQGGVITVNPGTLTLQDLEDHHRLYNEPAAQPLSSPVVTVKWMRSNHVSSCGCCQGAHVYARVCETVEDHPARFDGGDWFRGAVDGLPEGARFRLVLEQIPEGQQ